MADAKVQADGDIKLNFQAATLVEVVKVVLGDMLGHDYVIDSEIRGEVSMQTSEALAREDLLPTLELLLRMNGAAMITDSQPYRIVSLPEAITRVRAPQLGDSRLALPPGYSVRIVPLRFIPAAEMAEILQPFVSGTNHVLRVDTRRNLLILAGSGTDMSRLLETVHIFDVDRMAGMSVALYVPDFVDAKTLGEELQRLLADPERGLMANLVRFEVIERLNGLMLVTPQPEYLVKAKTWIERLDRDSGGSGRRLYIYRVQNGKATEIAKMLEQLYKAQAKIKLPPAEVAPGFNKETLGGNPNATAVQRQGRPQAPKLAAINGGLDLNTQSDIRIIADEPNNALLILAPAAEYRHILAALRQLDVDPMQVLVEVTIAEVTLTDNLQYGVEWFFKNTVGSSLTGIATLDLAGAGIGAIQPGFSYALQGTDDTVRGVLNLLATESNLSVISSPSLLVLNNHEANIQVGDEVPVAIQQQQSTEANANIINSIEYRDTGILLTVRPRINSGGLVIMDVEQEVSLVPTTNNADPLTPRIQQRKIASTVAVNSGDTIMLGGLIQNNRNQSESGVPELHTLPIVGAFFGTKADNQDRTELLVLITPRAIYNRAAALQVTEEFRRKLNSLIPIDATQSSKM